MNVDLSTTYLGIKLANPLVVSSCPLTGSVESLMRLEHAGAAAAVLPSLFEEQVVHEQLEVHSLYELQAESFAESLDYFPELELYSGKARYLELIERAKRTVSIPLIASLNGTSSGGWIDIARDIEASGADALELNIYYVPTSPSESAADVEARYLEFVRTARDAVNLPLAVKLGPFFTSLPHFGARVIEAGAHGLVLFNRYLEPDLDLEALELVPSLVFSRSYDSRLPLRSIAILRDHTTASLAATSGVQNWEDVAKLLLVGADAVMMAAALLQQGPELITETLDHLRRWFDERGYVSVNQLKGSMSRANCPDPGSLERLNYMRTLTTFTDQWNRSWG